MPPGLPAHGAQHSLAVTLTGWMAQNTPKSQSVTVSAISTPCQMRKGLFYFPLV